MYTTSRNKNLKKKTMSKRVVDTKHIVRSSRRYHIKSVPFARELFRCVYKYVVFIFIRPLLIIIGFHVTIHRATAAFFWGGGDERNRVKVKSAVLTEKGIVLYETAVQSTFALLCM